LYPHYLPKVFLITPQYPPLGLPMAEFSFRIADALADDFSVTVVAPNLEWKEVNGISLKGFVNPVYDHQNVVTWAFSASKEVERIIASEIYEKKSPGPLVVINWELTPGVLSLARFFSLPIYFIPFSFEVQRASGLSSILSLAIEEIEKSAVAASTLTILFDDALLKYYLSYGGPKEKVTVLRSSLLSEKPVLVKKFADLFDNKTG